VYLLIAGASGGKFLSGIRCIQVSPQRCQRARDGETSKLLTHNLKEGKEKLSIDSQTLLLKGTLHPFALSFVSLETVIFFEWSWFIPLFSSEMGEIRI